MTTAKQDNWENLKNDLIKTLNINNIDTICNTPDFILADYLLDCLMIYKKTKELNDKWHGGKVLESL